MSNTETIETTADNHDHSHEGHDHNHEGHDHQHGPTLNPECRREIVLEASVEEVNKAFRSILGNYKRQARIPGFRPGKAPESFLRRRFDESIKKDVVESLLPKSFAQALQKNSFVPVSEPQVTELTLEEGQPLHAKAIFEVVPEFSIDGYQDVKVEKPAVELSNDEYENEVEQIRVSRATVEPVEDDRPLTDGDWAEIAFKGQVEGEVENAAPLAEEGSLVEVGGKNTIEAFNTALRGAKLGQELKVEVTYPADYGDQRLSGKTVTFQVEVKGIKKRILPEWNDEFAKEFGEYENIAALETSIREHSANAKRRNLETEAKNKLLSALSDRFTFPVPEALVQQQIDLRLDRGLRALAQQGMSPEQMRTLDFSRLRDAQHESAVKDVKNSLILDKIAKLEGVTVSDEDLDREVQMAAMQSREPVETVLQRLTQDGGLARIREQLQREKAVDLLYERISA